MRFKGLGQLTLTEFRLSLRDPMTVFWTIAFPALWMGLFGSIFSEPMPGFGYEGLSHANFLLPGGIGIVVGSWRAASIVTQIIFIPMLFLSNLFMPIDIFPGWLQPISRALPLTPMNVLLRDIVYGVPSSEMWQLGIMAGWLVVGCLVILKFFRWE